MVTGNHTPVLLTFYGKYLDDHWGFASLETGLGGEVSGAKIDVGQFSRLPGGIGGRSGASAWRADFPGRFFCYAST